MFMDDDKCGTSHCLICDRYDDANPCGFENLKYIPARNHDIIWRLPEAVFVSENVASLDHKTLRNELLKRAEKCPELDKIKEIFKTMEEAKTLIHEKCRELDDIFYNNESTIKDRKDLKEN